MCLANLDVSRFFLMCVCFFLYCASTVRLKEDFYTDLGVLVCVYDVMRIVYEKVACACGR